MELVTCIDSFWHPYLEEGKDYSVVNIMWEENKIEIDIKGYPVYPMKLFKRSDNDMTGNGKLGEELSKELSRINMEIDCLEDNINCFRREADTVKQKARIYWIKLKHE